MRLRLLLRPRRPACSIPLSYTYYLSTVIYGWIEQSSPLYSAFLHEHGFPLDGTVRRFKHFCFSNLVIPRRNVENGRLRVLSHSIHWYISMPVEATLQHLVVGMFKNREFYIEREENRFVVEQVETLPEPIWERRMKFRMLSPLTVSVPEESLVHERSAEEDGSLPQRRLIAHYLRPNDPRLSEALQKNILNKYRSLHGTPPGDKNFHCTLDEKFIASRGGSEKISKLITIKQDHEDETKVRGFMCPVTIEGNADLIKLAYESGLGEKNSMGFGMLEVVER